MMIFILVKQFGYRMTGTERATNATNCDPNQPAEASQSGRSLVLMPTFDEC